MISIILFIVIKRISQKRSAALALLIIVMTKTPVSNAVLIDKIIDE